MIEIDILNKLNAPTREERLANLKEVLKTTEFPPMVPQYINNLFLLALLPHRRGLCRADGRPVHSWHH